MLRTTRGKQSFRNKHCKLYLSVIEAKKIHHRKCKAQINEDGKEEDDNRPEQNEQEEDEPEQSPNAEK